MQENTERREIAYHEYRVIARLLRAHVDEYQDRVRAMVAFGDLVTSGDTFDIDLLEVVEGWEDRRFGRFSRSEDLPLRGELRLYFLTPQEFEDPSVIPEPEEQRWVVELLERVRRGYEVVMESPPGWARRVLDQIRVYSTITAPPSGFLGDTDPFRLTRKAK
jgi:hypothetical protein